MFVYTETKNHKSFVRGIPTKYPVAQKRGSTKSGSFGKKLRQNLFGILIVIHFLFTFKITFLYVSDIFSIYF